MYQISLLFLSLHLQFQPMKSSLLFTAILSICLFINACQPKADVNTQAESEGTAEIKYDSVLAKQLGADDYGMKKYVVAFLKTGPNQELDSAQAADLQRAHLDNIFRMADEGKLVLAGPFLDGGDLKGIYIFNVETVEEATELTESDPAVQAGRFTMELHPWYGSAATMKINDLHKSIQKTQI